MSDNYQEINGLRLKNDPATEYDAKIYYKDGKPFAATLSESPNNQGIKFNQVSDRAMSVTADSLMKNSPEEMKRGDKIYMFAKNDNGSYKQQPFEVKHEPSPSISDVTKEEKTVGAYSANNGSDHQPLDSISKERMEMTISQLQGKNPMAENTMPQIDRAAEQKNNRN